MIGDLLLLLRDLKVDLADESVGLRDLVRRDTRLLLRDLQLKAGALQHGVVLHVVDGRGFDLRCIAARKSRLGRLRIGGEGVGSEA